MRIALLLGALLVQEPPLDEALEAATKAAAAKAAPAVVQIQTVGGAEVLGRGERGILRGRGPTTGVIVSPDGYIVSSSYNFASRPAAITVHLPSGADPLPARIVAQDHTRMIALLKVEAENLPTVPAAPKDSIRLGQWAIALGRTWSEGPTSPPSVSVGIISAVGRIWGKAVQTDAKVSPVNYGGPLIDLDGRAVGILVPLSPRAEEETAGVEWYDSGIGFAIPLEDILRVLPRLKEGKDLRRGMLGIVPKDGGPNAVPIIDQVFDDTPAAKVGLQPGDQIVAIDDAPISRQAQMMHALGPKYAGETIKLTVKRDGKDISFERFELVAPPTSHSPGWLGFLPRRDEAENTVGVRYVFPESPAAKAGLKAGDRIQALAGQPFQGRDALLARLAQVRPGASVSLSVRQADGKTETLTIKAAPFDPSVPADELPEGSAKQALKPKPALPPRPGAPPPGVPPPGAPGPRPTRPGERQERKPDPSAVAKGFFEQKDPALGRSSWLYVPENYDPNVSHALVVWLHPKGDTLEARIKELWQPLCDQHHIILLAPRAEHPTGWLTSEMDAIAADVRALLKTYTIDRQRIVLHGLGDGANLAIAMGFDARDLVRGVAAVGGVLHQPAKDNLAHQRLSFWLIGGARDPDIEAIRLVKPQLLANKFPVLYREIDGLGTGYLPDEADLAELIRWLDSLDRM
jgi:serine protease Do